MGYDEERRLVLRAIEDEADVLVGPMPSMRLLEGSPHHVSVGDVNTCHQRPAARFAASAAEKDGLVARAAVQMRAFTTEEVRAAIER
jgi:hypothetical protein